MTGWREDDSRRCYDVAIEEIRKICTRPDGSFDKDKAERMINQRDTMKRG